MSRVLVALPVDARPAVRSQVQDMVACAGWELRMPDVSVLGHLRQPGDRNALEDWLMEQAPQAAGFVLSLDMLVYGGLVPSRFIDDSLQSLQVRLEALEALHARWPDKPLFAFAATMRISRNNIAEEEKPYWAEHGAKLWEWSFHRDRAEHGLSGSEAAASAQAAHRLEMQIPAAIRSDYLQTRRRNLQITLRALQMVQSGVIQRLVLPQDDTAEFGLNIKERRMLQAQATLLGIESRVAIYPGADEVMHTLCARMVSFLEQRTPLRVFILPSDPTGLRMLRARYEDRPVQESILSQLMAVGAVGHDDEGNADVILAVHSQGPEQGDWAMNVPLPMRSEVAPAWFTRLHRAHQQDRTVAVADLAYANGGDPWLLRQDLPPLSAYAGWNTASNSLGSVLAQCVLGWGRMHEEHARRALSLRLLEDQLYQAQLRQELRSSIQECSLSPDALLQAARDLVLPAAHQFVQDHELSHDVAELHLPWNRTFEVDLRLERRA